MFALIWFPLSFILIWVCNTECPDFPYSPKNKVKEGYVWDFLCDNWKLPITGVGEVLFNASGKGLIVGIFESKKTPFFKYAILFAEAAVNESQVFVNADFDFPVGTFKNSIQDPASVVSYSVSFNGRNRTIRVLMNNEEVLLFRDEDYQAINARYISFSQEADNVIIYDITVKKIEVDEILEDSPKLLETKKTNSSVNFGEINRLSIIFFFGSLAILAIFKVLIAKYWK